MMACGKGARCSMANTWTSFNIGKQALGKGGASKEILIANQFFLKQYHLEKARMTHRESQNKETMRIIEGLITGAATWERAHRKSAMKKHPVLTELIILSLAIWKADRPSLSMPIPCSTVNFYSVLLSHGTVPEQPPPHPKKQQII